MRILRETVVTYLDTLYSHLSVEIENTHEKFQTIKMLPLHNLLEPIIPEM